MKCLKIKVGSIACLFLVDEISILRSPRTPSAGRRPRPEAEQVPGAPYGCRRCGGIVGLSAIRGPRPAAVNLVVNLRTAKALGLTIPESFLFRADEVIE